jgi:hypothetical protein
LIRLAVLLANDPNCLKFLGSAGANPQQLLSQIVDYGLYGHDLLPVTSGPAGTFTIRNGQSGPSPLVPNGAIVVNLLGAYYRPNLAGVPLYGDALNTIPGGTPQAQISILLHELAHATDVIAHDANDPTGNIHRATDRALQDKKNCGNLLKAAKK